MDKSSKLILNGDIVQEAKARVSPVNRGMMYGDGCFETMRSYSGKFLGWELHFERLLAGLDYLDMDAPFSSKELKSQVHQLLQQNQLAEREAMLRIQCWREGVRGYVTSSRKTDWMIQAGEIQPKTTPLKLALAQTRCIPSVALARTYKLSNGLNYIKAAQEAERARCDDALMLTMNDKISETTVANIFWVKEGQVFTPDHSCDLLPGVTRSAVLDVMEKLGIPVETGVYGLSAIQQAEAVFCTNSLVEIREVAGIEDTGFELDHPIVQQVKIGFEQLKEEEVQA